MIFVWVAKTSKIIGIIVLPLAGRWMVGSRLRDKGALLTWNELAPLKGWQVQYVSISHKLLEAQYPPIDNQIIKRLYKGGSVSPSAGRVVSSWFHRLPSPICA